MPLLWVLRDIVGLTGTKLGCGVALCGACTVHLDGQAIRSCITPAANAIGKNLTTIACWTFLPIGADIGICHPCPRLPYTLMTRADVLAIKAYLFSLKQVRYVPPGNIAGQKAQTVVHGFAHRPGGGAATLRMPGGEIFYQLAVGPIADAPDRIGGDVVGLPAFD